MAMHKSGRNDVLSRGASVKKDSVVRNDIGKRGGKDLYLRDYITRKQESDNFFDKPEPKKLTFEEWWETQVWAGFKNDPLGYIKNVWKAAQENASDAPSQSPGTGA